MKILDLFKSHQQKEENDFNLLPDGIFVLEQDGKIIDINSKVSQMYKMGRFEILGHYFSDFIENGTQVLNKIVQTGSSASVRAVIKNDAETRMYFDITASRSSENSRVYVVARNISKQQAAKDTYDEKIEVAQRIINEKNICICYFTRI